MTSAFVDLPAAPPDSSRQTTSSPYRKDIQGLRAIAVGVVFLFHLWPNRLSGGFVGVDVFFVISGFLITGHLLREAERTGRIGLARFWSRRIARLLPEAFLVLLATSAATIAIVPKDLWSDYFSQIRASGLYFQNWQLAANAVDYMAKDAKPTALQHYWSLSVEEQFYLVWPLLILVTLLAIGKILGRKPVRPIILALLVAVFAASFVVSVVMTSREQSWAYFASVTRAWEFAAGGLCAVFLDTHQGRRVHPGAAAGAGWLGIGLIVWSAMAFSGATLFPGSAAAIPVIGTALLIVNGDSPARWSTNRVLSARPMVWIGTISYAIYLWHWPLVVITPFVTGVPLRLIDKILLAAATLAIASITTRYVEDPLRGGKLLRAPIRAFAFAAIGALVFVGLNVGVQQYLDHERSRLTDLALGKTSDVCTGPGALDPKNACGNPMGTAGYLVPPEIVALQNTDPLYPGCQQGGAPTVGIPCFLGDKEKASTHIILAGDSHASQWFSGFDAYGKQAGWEIETFTKASCPMSKSQRFLDSEQTSADAEACDAWVDNVTEQITHSDADMVVLTSYQSAYEWTDGAKMNRIADPVEGYAAVFKAIADSGKQVRVIKAVPRTYGDYVTRCLVNNGRDLEACGTTRDKGLPPDLMAQAVERIDRPDVQLVNLDDQFCDAEYCYPVIGNVVVYRDYSHISAEYSQFLMKSLVPQLHLE